MGLPTRTLGERAQTNPSFFAALAAFGIAVVEHLGAVVELIDVNCAARVGHGGDSPGDIVVEAIIVGGLAVDGVAPLPHAAPGRI